MRLKRNKQLKICSIVLSALLIMQFVGISPKKVLASTAPHITYTVNGRAEVGNIIDIVVNVSNAQNLYGASIDFAYDSNVLKIESVTMGDVFNNTTAITYVNKIENGNVSIAMGLTGNQAGISKSGTLAVIKAKVLKGGTVNLVTTSSNNALSLSGNTVRVKLANNGGTSVSYTSENSSINCTEFIPAKIQSVTTDKVSPMTPNSTINVTANATGGSDILYQFWIQDKSGWKVVQDFSSKNTFTWKPTEVGYYQISVYAKDANSPNELDDVKIISFSIKEPTPAIMQSVVTNKKSPQTYGGEIEITATATGSPETLYQFWIMDSSGWILMQDYSSNNKFVWKPEKVGNYKISVYAKDRSSSELLDSVKIIDYSITQPKPVVVENLELSKKSPQPLGSVVDIKATASGSDNILYQFWIYDYTGWNLVQDYSAKNTFTWNPKETGSYKISVYAKDINSKELLESVKIVDYTVTDPLPAVMEKIETSKTSPMPFGANVDIKASASGSTNVLYQFWILDKSGWNLVQDYSSKNTYTWTPKEPGNYKISVYAKDANSKELLDSVKIIDFTVGQSKPAIVDSVTLSKKSPQPTGTVIDVSANASGSSNILYQFWIYYDSQWNLVQDYSSKNTFSWKPAKSGNYKISVYAKDVNSKELLDSCKIVDYTIK